MFGGAVGGLLVGPLAGWFSGESELPEVDLPLLVGGTLFGTVFIAISFVLTPLLAVLTLALMHYSGMGVTEPFGLSGAAGGMILGGIIGLIMGLQTGLTLWLYRGWAGLAEPTAR
jgi:hypothetical protein